MKTQIENRYKCPKKLWGKFSEKGKIAYNNVRSAKKDFVLPPQMEMTDSGFDVISHNFACLAAWEF
jgi:hypothetical protein